MNSIKNTTLPRMTLRSLLLAVCIVSLAIQLFAAHPVSAAAVSATTFQPVLTASPVSGNAPLTVNFVRSVTTDPNGPTISYAVLNYGDGTGPVDFGDGTTTFAINSSSSHTYMAGTYAATFTVYYNNATSLGTMVTITVDPSLTPEQPPLITASPTSGTVPLTVALTSSATMAPTGPMINSYQVNYGDGTSDQYILNFGDGAASFSRTTSHIYSAVGTYTATLTVTYNNAASASSSVTIIVNPVVSTVLRSTAIDLTGTLVKSKVSATGNVAVKDSNGMAIAGAVVSATWTKPGGGTSTQSVTTSSTGIAKFSTSGNRGTYTLKVNNISKTGYSFDKINSVLSNSITK
jgi:PKD repeat protein